MNRIIGVVLSLIYTEISREFLKSLHEETKKSGDKLLVFNSITDFRYEKYSGARSPYIRIPYDKLDALVVLNDTIRDGELLQDIINLAHKSNVPVIIARKHFDGEYSIAGDYKDAFKKIVRHVVEDCKAEDIYYVSGRRDYFTNPVSDSGERLKTLQETLAEYGKEIDEEHVIVGEYRERPTMDAIDELLMREDVKIDALICANDIMAMAASKAIIRHGYRVPEDVVVTGFDGLECASYSKPKLTTCRADLAQMSELIIKMIDEICSGNTVIRTYTYGYKAIISESTGDKASYDDESDSDGIRAYNYIIRNEEDEEFSNRWLDDLDAKGPNLSTFAQSVGSYLGKRQILFLRNDDEDLKKAIENFSEVQLSDKIVVFNSNAMARMGEQISVNQIFNVVESKLQVEGISVMTGVYIKDLHLGYHYEQIFDVHSEGRQLNRHVLSIIKGLQSSFNVVRTSLLKLDIERNKYIDSLTGIDNMRGFQKWFEAFSKDAENHEKHFEFCVFSFINHDIVLRDYSTDECDECLLFIADNLKKSHPEGTYIARISATGFVVIVSARKFDDRENIVYSSVNKFYNSIFDRNGSNQDGFQIEVSSGSVQLNPGWSGDMSTYIDASYMEIYKNRAAMYKNNNNSKHINIFDEFNALDKLNIILSENRLTYFFQPIVSAYTGNIVAYEALMRVTGDIPSNPLELLSIARKHRKLYGIERATFFNVFETFAQRKKEFKDRLVFINTIPDNFLIEEDVKLIKEKYEDLFSDIVVEITEDNTVEMDELDRIRRFGGDDNVVRIAIDDYGTGHSNVINLINYKPDIVKIDRFLVTDIHKDDNKRMMVMNVIEFAKNNNIKTLAEGVETKEELLEVIRLGIDYIQGYYTAKPSDKILDEIDPVIKETIINRR